MRILERTLTSRGETPVTVDVLLRPSGPCPGDPAAVGASP